jgi:hypothetical protein
VFATNFADTYGPYPKIENRTDESLVIFSRSETARDSESSRFPRAPRPTYPATALPQSSSPSIEMGTKSPGGLVRTSATWRIGLSKHLNDDAGLVLAVVIGYIGGESAP